MNENELEPTLNDLVDAVVKAIAATYETQDLEGAIAISDQIHRLPANLMTEVLNSTMLNLLQRDPALCRWFIIEIFLRHADPNGRADVAERINLLMADLRAQQADGE